MAELGVELVKRVDELRLLTEQRPEFVRWECAGSVALGPGEFCSAGDGGLVDPASGNGLSEDVGCGPLAAGGDVGVVVVTTSGEGDVDASDVAGSVEHEDGSVDDAALGGVAGLGVAEFDVFGDVAGGEADGAAGPGGGDVAVAVEGGDGPLVTVPGRLGGAEAMRLAPTRW